MSPLKSVDDTVKESRESLIHSKKSLYDVTKQFSDLMASGVITHPECIELCGRRYAELRDAGDITQDEFIGAITELSTSQAITAVTEPPAVVVPPSVAVVTIDQLYGYVDGFLSKVLSDEWTIWAQHADDTRPSTIWGVSYMRNIYCKTMRTVLRNSIAPEKSDTELSKRYQDVVLKRFENECKKYKDLKIEHKDNPAILYGVEHTIGHRIDAIKKEIKGYGGVEYSPRRLITEEATLERSKKKLGNMKATIRRYYGTVLRLLAYLELKQIDIMDLTVEEYQRYQAYAATTYKRAEGKDYSATTWNDLAERVVPFISFLTVHKGIIFPYNVASEVPRLEVIKSEQPRPSDPYKIVFKDNIELTKRQDEVIKIYRCIRNIKHPILKKHKDLLDICFRLTRETGLRGEHVVWIKWGILPKKDTKPVMTAKPVKLVRDVKHSVSKVYPIDYLGTVAGKSFSDMATEAGKGVPREDGLISAKLTEKIIQYRKDHPETTKDDYFVFSGKVLLKNWLGDYRTCILSGKHYVKDAETQMIVKKPYDSNPFNYVYKMVNEVCHINVKSESFRDSFMTLLLELMFASSTEFLDITGDIQSTAIRQYRGVAGTVKRPIEFKNKLSYAEIISVVFNEE